jgi:hypothetical protein
MRAEAEAAADRLVARVVRDYGQLVYVAEPEPFLGLSEQEHLQRIQADLAAVDPRLFLPRE